MKTKLKDDEKSPLPAWIAVKDAQEYTKANMGSYSPAEVELQGRVFSMAATIFNAQVYRNARKNFLVVKVTKPSVRDKNSDLAAVLMQFCIENKIDMSEGKGHIFYRIPKL